MSSSDMAYEPACLRSLLDVGLHGGVLSKAPKSCTQESVGEAQGPREQGPKQKGNVTCAKLTSNVNLFEA